MPTKKPGPAINAYQLVNDNAVREARQLDALHCIGRGHSRMPLFGVPVLLKDNIDTADMPTAAGSVALNGSLPPDDAFITKKLRAAGAIILGKGTLTEFANFIAVGMPTGYSSLGGFGFNPYDPRVDPRTEAPFNDGRPVLQTGGSSSGPGIGVNANLVAVAIGTETSGSILSPASANGVVGIKPTVGLVSRDGIIPITADQDTAGPITRTVTDAAIVLGVIAGYDPNDPATDACLTPGNCFDDYTRFLNKKALRGARLAVPPFPENRRAIMEAAIAVMRAQGAHVELIESYDVRIGMPQLGTCIARPAPTDLTCSTVLLYGFKRDLNAYLAATQAAPSRTLAEVIAFNDAFDPTDEIRTGHRDRRGSARRVSRQRRYHALPGGSRGRSAPLEAGARRRLQRARRHAGNGRRLRRRHSPWQCQRQRACQGGLPECCGTGRLQCPIYAHARGSADRRAVPIRRDFLRTGVFRTQADRVGVRVRAGDAASGSTGEHSGASQ